MVHIYIYIHACTHTLAQPATTPQNVKNSKRTHSTLSEPRCVPHNPQISLSLSLSLPLKELNFQIISFSIIVFFILFLFIFEIF